jgi:hypothetical protein
MNVEVHFLTLWVLNKVLLGVDDHVMVSENVEMNV